MQFAGNQLVKYYYPVSLVCRFWAAHPLIQPMLI